MKFHFFFFLVFFKSASLFSQNIIEISEKGFFIDSVSIKRLTDSATIVNLLGQPDEIFPLKVNTIWTYHKQGILVYVNPRTQEIESVKINYIKQDYKFSAKNNFKGKVILYGNEISKNTPLIKLGPCKTVADFPGHHSYLLTTLNYLFKVYVDYADDYETIVSIDVILKI